MSNRPYRSTPVFDEHSLPQALLRRHSTKAGVWGRIHVTEGRIRLIILDPPSEHVIDPAAPMTLLPGQAHQVELMGPMRMRIDFHDQPPDG